MRLGERQGDEGEKRYPTNAREWLVALWHEALRAPVWPGLLAVVVGAAIGARCQR